MTSGNDAEMREGGASSARGMHVRLRRLTDEEAARYFGVKRRAERRAYVEALQDLAPGDAVEMVLQGQSRRSVKRYVQLAARDLQLTVVWSRVRDDTVRFLVLSRSTDL